MKSSRFRLFKIFSVDIYIFEYTYFKVYCGECILYRNGVHFSFGVDALNKLKVIEAVNRRATFETLELGGWGRLRKSSITRLIAYPKSKNRLSASPYPAFHLFNLSADLLFHAESFLFSFFYFVFEVRQRIYTARLCVALFDRCAIWPINNRMEISRSRLCWNDVVTLSCE